MNSNNRYVPIQTLSPIQSWESGTAGKFNICLRCMHSAELKTQHGESLVCLIAPGNKSIGAARAVGQPCGPEARQAQGPCVQALSLEITESETSAGDWARASPRSQARKDAQP